MNRFHSAKIYRLVCDTGKEYIGSTIRPLNERLWEHKKIYNSTTSKYLINPRIELIKNFPCKNKKELELEEAKYIKASNNCINSQIPHRTREEWRIDNREKILEQRKQYRLENKDKIKEADKQHYMENKEQITERQKQYYLKNKEKKSEYQTQYYLKNKEIIKEKRNEKFNCECGGRYSRSCKSQHIKSKKHQTYLKGLSSEAIS